MRHRRRALLLEPPSSPSAHPNIVPLVCGSSEAAVVHCARTRAPARLLGRAPEHEHEQEHAIADASPASRARGAAAVACGGDVAKWGSGR